MKSSKPVRGTRDILPDEMKLRQEIENKILNAFKKAGYNAIETPSIENLDLLLDSQGGENLRMLFTIAKRGNKFKPTEDSKVEDLCDTGLRFDLTLPLSRYYSNNKDHLESPFKSIQIGNVYRAERPQKGRYRSFKQCDIDIIGDHTVGAEIDLIHTISQALLDVGLSDFTIKISDRKLFTRFLESKGIKSDKIDATAVAVDKLDKIGADQVIAELVEKGIAENTAKEVVDSIGKITLDDLAQNPEYAESCENLKRIIDAVNATSGGKYKIVFDFSLVRGMGYYTGPVFEVEWGDVGYSVAGGGRYDEMIGKTSKQSEPAVGFSIGFERLVDILTNIIEMESEPEKKVLLLCNPNQDDMQKVITLADEFKADNFIVNIVPKKRNLGKQIEHAREKGYQYLCLYGRDSKPVTI